MQTQAMRVYRSHLPDAMQKGVIPMFTRVKAMTGKGAIKAFIERYKTCSGLVSGRSRRHYRQRAKGGRRSREQNAEMKKAG